MIIIKLTGGLGNQLFQYAFGKNISTLKNEKLFLDISKYDEVSEPRKYSLGAFSLNAKIITKEEIDDFFFRNKESVIKYIKPYYKQLVFKERYFHYDPNVTKVNRNVYFDGYWQSEKYFLGIDNVLRRNLAVNHVLDTENVNFLKELKENESVCIFVRRAELVTNPTYRNYLGYCRLKYYIDGINFFKKMLKAPHFYIFTDDIAWCFKEFSNFPKTTIIEHFKDDNLYTKYFHFMYNCKHFIIPNSTFGWWAAWLGKYKKKIVVAPKNWFRTNKINTMDLIPQAWYKL